MADSEKIYGSAAGFIQFDIDEREYNDGIIRDATIRSLASGDLLRISFFPDFEDIPLERGDFIAVDGSIVEREVEYEDEDSGETVSRTFVNFTAKRLFVGETFAVAAPKDEKKAAGAKKRKTF